MCGLKLIIEMRLRIFLLAFLVVITAEQRDWIIQADNLGVDLSKETFKYQGSVRVEGEDIQLRCDRLEGKFTKDNQIEQLVASGNVHLLKISDGTQVLGDRAVFDNRTKKVTVLGQPRILKEKNSIKAEEIIYDLSTKKFEARGSVESLIFEDNKTQTLP
jgi:lipopolysaccharide transport protein LptA